MAFIAKRAPCSAFGHIKELSSSFLSPCLLRLLCQPPATAYAMGGSCSFPLSIFNNTVSVLHKESSAIKELLLFPVNYALIELHSHALFMKIYMLLTHFLTLPHLNFFIARFTRFFCAQKKSK